MRTKAFMDIFVKELWAFYRKETAIFVDLLPFCAVTLVESPLIQGALYSTADWEGFIQPNQTTPLSIGVTNTGTKDCYVFIKLIIPSYQVTRS